MINDSNVSSPGGVILRCVPLLGGMGHGWGKVDEFLDDMAIDFVWNFLCHEKKALQKPAHQMHVAVLMINDPGVLVHPTFFKTIISTVISPGELLLMVNKSVDNIKFLNEDDNSVVPPGCRCAVVLIIAVSSAGFFCELRKELVPAPGWRPAFVEASYIRSGGKHFIYFLHLMLIRVLLRKVVSFPFYRSGLERFSNLPEIPREWMMQSEIKTQDHGTQIYTVLRLLSFWGYCAKRQAFSCEGFLVTGFVTSVCEKGNWIQLYREIPILYYVSSPLLKGGSINCGENPLFVYLGRHDTRYFT